MPCYDSRDHDPSEIAKGVREKALKEFTHNSPVAELLCSVMKCIQPSDQVELAIRIPGLAEWWEEHLKRDMEKAEEPPQLLSNGKLPTLANHRELALAAFGEDSKAIAFLDEKIKEQGPDELVLVDEQQMVHLLIGIHLGLV